jgi:acetoin utilization deacetylase AcuC-like enzyme
MRCVRCDAACSLLDTSVFERVVEPALQLYAPDLILVSSGFDASALDPLSHIMLNSSAFGMMARKLVAVANASPVTKGRIVFVHEGGYSDIHAPFCGLRVVEAMLGVEPVVVDPVRWVPRSTYMLFA